MYAPLRPVILATPTRKHQTELEMLPDPFVHPVQRPSTTTIAHRTIPKIAILTHPAFEPAWAAAAF